MIKVSVMYPSGPDARFDMDYYRDRHMPMVQARMGSALKFYTVDRGLAGGAPGQPPVYAAAAHLHCESVEAFQASFAQHGRELLADVPNFTDITPVIQVSEVIVG